MRLPEAFRSLRYSPPWLCSCSRIHRRDRLGRASLQLRSSDELRGRVTSLFTLIHGGCFQIAAPLIGAVAERSSVSAAFFLWGAGGLAVLALLMGARRRVDRRRSALAGAIHIKASTE